MVQARRERLPVAADNGSVAHPCFRADAAADYHPTVLGRYDRWMRQFPTPAHLAAVDEQTALRSWEGLGYYRRVRSLQAIAREIVNEFGGRFPDNAEG